MSKLDQKARGVLSLLLRSPDIGDGWRQVSSMLWPLVRDFGHPELLETDKENLRVRLSPRGLTVVEYV